MNRFLFTALALAMVSSAWGDTKDEAAVRAAHDAFVKAAKTGDAAALDKLFADNLQYSHSSAKLENKQEAISALAKSKGDFEVHSQTIHVYGNVATIRAKVTAHNPAGDIPLTMLQVWVRNNGAWQMVERHTTRIPAQ